MPASCLLHACFILLYASAGTTNITQGMKMSFPGKGESRRFCLLKCRKESSSLGIINIVIAF
jgi:hypothetical protein